MQSWEGKDIRVNILYSRAGVAQHIWVANEKGAILIDTGDGIVRDILSNELDLNQLNGIVITHGHYDHVGGLHSLLGFLRCKGKKGILPIYAPRGCTEAFSIVDNFIKCYPDTIPFKISCKEIQERQVFKVSGMAINAYPVVHHGSIKDYGILEQIPAMGYRISYKREIIAISGDTGICPSLKRLVKGADLAILEATFGTKRVKEESLKKEHLSEDLAKEIGKLAKEFILVHKGLRKGTMI
ncbi:ribonuclease Z [candidate division WOR-3 bacterium]|nr:ribonuclease Z [candidate division WOR-3 bacterium]